MAPTATAPASKETRIAIVSAEKCKPKKCHQECKKSCPVVRMGELSSWCNFEVDVLMDCLYRSIVY